MQKVLFLMLCTLFSFFGFAQKAADKKFGFGLGPGYSIPVGVLKDTYAGAIGINFIGKYNITNDLSVFVEASAQLFNTKSGQDHDLNFPFIGGVRYTYHGFFTGVGLGHSIWANDFDGFTYDLQLGYSFGSINVLSHYASSKTPGYPLSYFGFKVYYIF